MDETGLAFSHHAPRDVIALRELYRDVEIGAFADERGVVQRLCFEVHAEVTGEPAGDDVDKVVSYDTLIGAVDASLAEGRVDLLETLVDRIAARVFSEPRVARMAVRIDKLERGEFVLGVEALRVRGEVEPVALPAAVPEVCLMVLGSRVPEADGPVLYVVTPGYVPKAQGDEARARVMLLAMEQAAWIAAEGVEGARVVSSRTEIGFCAAQGIAAFWAPSRLVLAAVEPPEPRPEALAAWIAGELAR
ncbi:MAG: dihydroneopterin aldolase [Vannielia sp.]|uniref:dihydroneopterin aldolase n=1 Tax=Vannielia sp. TaxID=2813045 RepID=UPI003B8AFE4E